MEKPQFAQKAALKMQHFMQVYFQLAKEKIFITVPTIYDMNLKS